MKIVIHGQGTMGKILRSILEEEKKEFYFVDSLKDVPLNEKCMVIDFSHFSKIQSLVEECSLRGYPLLIATTGYSGEDLKRILYASNSIPILLSSNTSFGIHILNGVVEKITESLKDDFDIEVIEKHHNKKLDSPSGTAKTLIGNIKKSLKNEYSFEFGREGMKKRERKEIGVHSIRGGSIVGEHTVLFLGDDEVIEITHKALSKRIFAQGALKCIEILKEKSNGFYTMDDIFKKER